MAVFVMVLIILGLVVVAMSVGVLFGRKPISGSCGGMAALGMEVACDVCGGDKQKCEKEVEKSKQEAGAADLSYDATHEKH